MTEEWFMGRPIEYWIDLQARFDEANPEYTGHDAILEEIMRLRGKVSFYESRIKQMALCMNKSEEV